MDLKEYAYQLKVGLVTETIEPDAGVAGYGVATLARLNYLLDIQNWRRQTTDHMLCRLMNLLRANSKYFPPPGPCCNFTRSYSV